MKPAQLFVALLCLILLSGCAGLSGKNTDNQKPYRASDTSATIDLTNPANDMWERIRRGFAIPNLQDELSEQWTNYYASHPESVYRMSQRAAKYLYFIVGELEQRGMPTELALLPFVESAYNPTAYSKAKASGLWQFIPSTALSYNLQLDIWHDQRRDPVASTHAALDYLSYLYDFQGDWYLALASYNWGEGAVRRALGKIEDTELPPEYLSLTMPAETRNYVPKLQAIKNIVANPQKYGVLLPEISNTPYFTTIRQAPAIEIEVAARLAEMPVDEFKMLNASFNQPVIYNDQEPVLLLPTDRVDIFNANLLAYQTQLNTWQTYKAQKGESYAAIAQKFGITLAQLEEMNGINSKKTPPASRALIVPSAPPTESGLLLASLSPPASPAIENTAPAAVLTKTGTRRDVIVIRNPAAAPVQAPAKNQSTTHTVKRGDTLFSLAKRYNTTVDTLRKINNLNSNNLSLGKRIRLPGNSQVRS